MSGDPNKGDLGVDRVEGEEGEMNLLCQRFFGVGVSEGVKKKVAVRGKLGDA